MTAYWSTVLFFLIILGGAGVVMMIVYLAVRLTDYGERKELSFWLLAAFIIAFVFGVPALVAR